MPGHAAIALAAGPALASYQLLDNMLAAGPPRTDGALFDGIDTTLPGLVRFVAGKPPKELVEGLTAVAAAVTTAQKSFDTLSDDAVLQPLLAGLHAGTRPANPVAHDLD